MNTFSIERKSWQGKVLKEKYKVPLKVEREVYLKIQELCSRISEVEWSGVLFYQMVGDLHTGKAKITLKDILPMDIGSSSYTEFDSDERFAEFMSQKMKEHGAEEVLSWKQGLIHSHNNMRVFFSGTDENEIYGSSHCFAQYLSFICNNRMEFTARVAQTVKGETSKVKVPMSVINSKGKKVQIMVEEADIQTERILSYDCEITSPKSSFTKDEIFVGFVNKLFKKPEPVRSSGESWSGQRKIDFPPQRESLGANPSKPYIADIRDDYDKDIRKSFVKLSNLEKLANDCGISERDVENITEEGSVETCELLEGMLEMSDITAFLFARDFKANMITYLLSKKMNTEEILEIVESFMYFVEENWEESDYSASLHKTLRGWKNNLTLVIKKKNGRDKLKV